ncbi:MAG TPA: T9SS type A sorting domain-containing protein [Bacteroidales bacterium]|nr:T9SS type A sorting domain-containing protein [Bacteroidales bacterium]
MKTKTIKFITSIALLAISLTFSYRSFSQCMTWDWATNSDTPPYHCSGMDFTEDIVTDADNNIIAVGNFASGELYFGSTILTNSYGSLDIFVVKYDNQGNALWAISGTGDQHDIVNAVAVGTNGDVYIVGNFASTSLSFGTTVLNNTSSSAGNNDVFVAKLDGETGNIIWAYNADGDGDDYALDISVDGNGNPIITGYFQQADDLTFGALTLTKPCHNWGMYLLKLNSSGAVIWGQCAQESYWGGCKGYRLTTDNQNNIFVVGTYQFEPITFGSTTLTYDINQGEQIFLTKYNSAGTVQWAKKSSGVNNYGGLAHVPDNIVCDNFNNVFITGYFDTDAIGFGTVTLNSSTAPAADIFLAKYNSAGTPLWVKGATAPTMSNNYGKSVSADLQGNVFLTGHFNSSSIDFGSSISVTNASAGTSDIFIAKYDNNGNISWAESYGANSNEEAKSIYVNDIGELYFCGNFTSPSITLDDTTINNISGQPNDADIFLGKLVNSIKPIFVTTDVLCYGGSDGEINLTVNGGTSPYNYNWSNSSDDEDITGLTIGTYSVTIIDDNGCEKIDSTEIFQPEELVSSVVQITDVTCFGGNDGAVNIDVTGGIPPYEYDWSNSDNTQDIDNVTAGSYYVTITDAHNCTENNSAVVNQPTDIEIYVVLVTNVSCNGDSDGAIDIEVSGGTSPYTYLWSTTDETEDIDNLSADTYYITVTDSHACIKTGSVIVSEPDVLSSTILSTDVLCFGGSDGSVDLTPQGGTSPYSFEWSNSETGQNLSGLIIGTYDVTITDANNCLAYNSTMINQPDELVINIISASDLACYGDSDGIIDIEVAGGVGAYEYLWSNEETSQDIDNLTGGEYFVTVTDSHDCTLSTSAIITQPDEIVITPILMTHVSCHGENEGALDVEITGGAAPYGQIWSNLASTTLIEDLVAGIYTITVTDDSGCTATESFEITQPDELSSEIFPNDIPCFGGSNGTIDLTVIGGTEPYSFEWSNSETTQNLTGLIIGTYDVTITDDNGCIAYNSASITEPDELLIFIALHNNVSCFGGSDGSVDIFVTGGVTPYLYNWSNEAEIQDIDNLVAGEYHITVTDSNNCTAENHIIITEPDEIVINTVSITDANCYGDSNGSIDIEVTGGSGSYTYLWSETSETQDIDNIPAGTYIVTVTDDNDCIQTAEIVVGQPEVLSHYFEIDHICYGETNGSIDLTIYGGTQPYSYFWNTGSTDEDLFNQPAGDYFVTITDSHGCIYVTFPSIMAPSTPISISYDSYDVLCHGDNTGHIYLNVSGSVPPYTYLWSNEEETQNIDNLSAGTYHVTVTDDLGCTATETIIINEPPVLEIDFTSIDISCHGGSDGGIDISVTGGTTPYSYYWSNGSESEDQTGLEAYVYSVFVFDDNNCSEIETVVINQPEQMSAEFDITNTCYNTDDGAISMIVSGGTPPYSYLWSNDDTEHNIFGLITNTYYVTVTDFNSCEAFFSATLEQADSEIEIDHETIDVLCHGGNTASIDLSVAGSVAPYTYLWSSGSTNEDINNLTAGDYTITVTDSYNCTATETISITEPEALNIEFTVTDDTTNNCLGEIFAEVTGGILPYDYQWYDPQMQDTQTADSLCSGHYMLVVSDANGCIVSEIAFVNSGNVGISSNVFNQELNVYPIPSDGIINIDLSESYNLYDAGTIIILNISGQIIYETKIADRIISTDLSKIANSGLYLIQIIDKDGNISATKKIILK